MIFVSHRPGVARHLNHVSCAPELNLRAERAKPCGLGTSPEGASLSQRGVFSPAQPAKRHIFGQEVQLPGVLSSKILRNSNDALRGRKIIYGEWYHLNI